MLDGPPGVDPHAGWCGETGLMTRPYPIMLTVTIHQHDLYGPPQMHRPL
jgi:hypothetical protein